MAANLTRAFLKPLKNIQRVSGALSQQKHRFFYDYAHEPFYPLPNRVPRWQTVEEAVSVIKSNDNVYIHGAAATPITLVNAMTEYGAENNLTNIKLFHIHTEGIAPYTRPEYEGIFRSNSFFIGGNCREAVNAGRADFTPIFLGEIPLLFRRNIINLDVALIMVSRPDDHGFCTLGPSVDCTRAAIQNAKHIIGLVNPKMPRTFGDGIIHKSHFDALVEDEFDLPEKPRHVLTDEEKSIGRYIAENLVEDGATLQMGIGSIPDAVLEQLQNHQNLGIHSEMFSDGVVDLIKSGAVTNAHKKIHQGKIVGGFCVGTRSLYDYMDDNPFIVMCDIAFVNNTSIISQNPRVTAINSCVEVDLTGQVVSDSIGTRMYSGAGVVTTRAHVHYIVTEFGIAYLFGKNLRQRAHALINIAHPDHRESLERASFERLKVMPSSD
uniref:Uncharacterized protein LOC100372560 n=1 Tax=Saccoglossus kowalevskii TaxID=10224 RepID=A0ABM0LW97_SACKO|nr:PREDICTED: uncharacterized protein LOC100372560 [Saccoglossus kowalevskii]